MNDSFGQPQSVLVLGGSSEIAGAILAELIARRTQTVILAGRGAGRPGPLEDAADRFRTLGANTVRTIDWDVLDSESHAAVLGSTFRDQPIDMVLMAVGVLGEQTEITRHPADARPLIDTNFAAPAVASLAVANELRTQGHGVLVVLSSVAGEVVRQDNFVYGASKAGLDGFALGLADSMTGSGAWVMVVRPGFVRTRMTKGRPEAPFSTDPDAVARAVINGLARRKTIVWSPPILRSVMAVLRHLPRSLIARLPR